MTLNRPLFGFTSYLDGDGVDKGRTLLSPSGTGCRDRVYSATHTLGVTRVRRLGSSEWGSKTDLLVQSCESLQCTSNRKSNVSTKTDILTDEPVLVWRGRLEEDETRCSPLRLRSRIPIFCVVWTDSQDRHPGEGVVWVVRFKVELWDIRGTDNIDDRTSLGGSNNTRS